jgi:uncharacterized membrane protein
VTSVGWLGADAVLLALSVTGATNRSTLLGLPVDAVVYPAAWLVGVAVVIPLSWVAWLSGVVLGLGTRWGLLRHWWVLAKLVTTSVMALLVLFVLVPSLRHAAELATTTGVPDAKRTQLLFPPIVACALLIGNVVLGMYKPWGRIPRSGDRPPQPNVERTIPAGSDR